MNLQKHFIYRFLYQSNKGLFKWANAVYIPANAHLYQAKLLCKSCLKSSKLVVKLSGNSVANLLVEVVNALAVLKPKLVINGKKISESLLGDVKAFKLDVINVGNVTDRSLNSAYLTVAASKDPHKNTHIVAEAGPDEVTLVIGSEPVNVEDLRSVGKNLTHIEPVLPVVTHIVAYEGTHSHRIATNYADCTCSCCGSLGSHDGTNEGTVLPACRLIYEGSGLCTTAAEYDRGDRNACGIVELIGETRTVSGHSGESGVGMRTGGVNLILLVILGVIPLLTLPVKSVLGRIIIETFPPDGVVIKVVTNVGEDGILHSGVKSVGVGVLVGTGSNAEEAVLGVNCPKSAVLNTEPSNIVTYTPGLIALVLVDCGRNKHCKVSLTASRGECSTYVLNLSLGILDTENEHMLCHPAFLSTKVGGYTESEALLTEKNVSAVTGVNRPDGVVLGEMTDVSLLLIDVCASVKTLDEVSAVAESLKNVGAYSGHDDHVKYNVDGVGELDTVLSEVGAYYGHGVRNNVHGLVLVRALVKLGKLLVALLGIHPVVNVTRILLLGSTDEGSVLNSCNVVDSSSVKVAVRIEILVKLYKLTKLARFLTKSLSLLQGAVDKNDLRGVNEVCHLSNPLVYKLVVGNVCVHGLSP